MTFNRRQFIIGSTTLTMLGSPLFSARASGLNKRNLIVVILRGGLDGLAAVPPKDRLLQKARPDISSKSVIKLTSDFSLHPELKTFHKLWKDNQAAVVHATNIPYTDRSHFEGQDVMETGSTSPYASDTGWLGRGMESAELAGLAVSLPMPLLLRGNIAADNFFPASQEAPKLFNNIVSASLETFDKNSYAYSAIKQLSERPQSMIWDIGSKRDAANLSKIAARQLIKEDGPRVAVFDINGFDTHSGQGSEDGELAEHLSEFDSVIKNLKEGLGSEFSNSLIISLTEFGRKVEQNGGSGTEHGYGTAILMAGGLVRKSEVISDWPGLKRKDLFEGQDLNSTIDSRAIYCSAMAACFDVDFDYMRRKAFWGDSLPNLTDKLFKV